jgi:hypothetical protein
MLPKLVRSVAVDAIDAGARIQDGASSDRVAQAFRPASVLRAQAAQFLAVAANAPHHRTAGVGLGTDCRLTAPRIAGAALALRQHVVHVSAFAL